MQENFSPYPPPKGGGLAARSFVKYRMLRDEAEDPKLARKNIRREEWKSHDFLVDQFWDIDHRYFGDFFRNNGWQDDWIQYRNAGSHVLGYFDHTSVFMTRYERRGVINWVNNDISQTSITGITISSQFVFKTLHNLRDTLAHEMCHAYCMKTYKDLTEYLHDMNCPGSQGHGPVWQKKTKEVNKLSQGMDDFDLKQYASGEKAAYHGNPEDCVNFSYYYFDMREDMSNIRALRLPKPEEDFEEVWYMYHFMKNSEAQDILMLVEASDEFMNAVVSNKSSDVLSSLKSTVNRGRLKQQDGFKTISYAEEGIRDLLKLAQEEDCSYYVNGELKRPCRVIEKWTFEELDDAM